MDCIGGEDETFFRAGGGAGRVIQLRAARSDRGTGSAGRSVRRRLSINGGPLVVGDALRSPSGVLYTLRGVSDGVATKAIARRRGIVPKMMRWEFSCVSCGSLSQYSLVASEKPLRERCDHCLALAHPRSWRAKKMKIGLET